MKRRLLSLAQMLIILLVRPYTSRELVGWGTLYRVFVGDYRRDWFWQGGPVRSIRGKRHGYLMHLDLAKWADRSAFFLGRWYDLATQLLISDLIKPGDTVVDVGCNRGMFALAAVNLVGDAGKVICFDPNPNCLAILDQHISINQIANVVVHRFGLGDSEEELTLQVPVINAGEGTFGKSSYDEDITYQVVSSVKFGDRLLGNEKPTLIKIDVEGFECRVVRGLSETISWHHPIILTEVISQHLLSCGSSVAQLLSIMHGLNYIGFRLALARDGARHHWTAIRFVDVDDVKRFTSFDAVWIHRASVSPHGDWPT